MDDLWPRDGVNLRIDEPCGRACILLVDSIVPLERPNDEGNDGKGANFMSTKNLTFIFPMRLKVLHGCYWRTCNRKDCKSIGSPGIRKEREESEKDEREKPLLFKRHKVVRFLISPKKKKVKIEVNKIMNPAFLLGTAFNRLESQRSGDPKDEC